MELSAAMTKARAGRDGVLVTLRRNGRPQLSNVNYLVNPDDEILVSITAGRAKYHNLTRNPWVAMYVGEEEFYAGYVVIEGRAEMTPPAERGDDSTVESLVDMYRGVAGEHPDWDDYRRAMVEDHRVLLTIHPEGAYGMSQG